MSTQIHLPCGRIALIDDADAEIASRHKWRSKGSEDDWANGLYVASTKGLGLHRLVMAPPPGMSVDHINHNGLDNRRANLRLCTTQENARNRRPNRNAKVAFKGVTPTKGKFQASICVGGAHRYLGLHKNLYSAALAYDEAALAEFGEFAHVNFSPSRDWIIAGRQVGLGANLETWARKKLRALKK